MTDNDSEARATDEPACPPWCAGDHGREDLVASGFFHSSKPVTVELGEDDPRQDEARTMDVAVRQYVPSDDDPSSGVYKPMVEVTTPDNAGCQELTVLSPEEAERVANALLEAKLLMAKGRWDICPAWCTTRHAGYVAEGGDQLEHWGPSREITLSTIHNYVDGRVERDGGGAVGLCVGQRSLSEGIGFEGPATVEMLTRDIDHNRTVVKLTSGEARTLASQLVSLADVIDQQPA